MAVTFVAIGSLARNDGGTDVAVTAPSINVGDILIANAYGGTGSGTTSYTPTTPGGWNHIRSDYNTDGSTTRYGTANLYWREADGGANDSPTFDFGTTVTYINAFIRAYRGVDTSNPVANSAFKNPGTTSPLPAFDSITNTADGYVDVSGHSYLTETGTTHSFSLGFTERLFTESGRSVWCGNKAGASGNTDATQPSQSTTLIRATMHKLVLRPAPSGKYFFRNFLRKMQMRHCLVR